MNALFTTYIILIIIIEYVKDYFLKMWKRFKLSYFPS